MISSSFLQFGEAGLLVGVVSASLLGSVHCAGMCGPFVAVYSGAGESSPRGMWRAHAAYHGGRAATYLGLGAVGGGAGKALDRLGDFAGLSHLAALVSGVLVILWGLAVFIPGLASRLPIAQLIEPGLIRLGKKPRVFRASLLGVFTPLLPCGWLYAFVLTAAGTGSVFGGLSVMGAFWLGTVPALLGMGAVLSRMGDSLRRRLPMLTGATLIALGLWGVFSRMAHLGEPGQSPSSVTFEEKPSCH